MTDREKLARELYDEYVKTPTLIDGITDINWNGHSKKWREQWCRLADHVLKREIKCRIKEVRHYQKMFSKSEHKYIFTERLKALEKQLGVEDGKN